MHTRERVRETLSCAWCIVPERVHVQRERDLGAAFDVSLRPVTLPSFAAIPCPRHEAGACAERERRAEETGAHAHAHAHENACDPNPPRCPCKTHANEFASLLYCTVSLLSAGCSRSRRFVGRPSVWSCVLEPSTASSPPQNLVKTTRILDVRRNKATEARLSPSSAPTRASQTPCSRYAARGIHLEELAAQPAPAPAGS